MGKSAAMTGCTVQLLSDFVTDLVVLVFVKITIESNPLLCMKERKKKNIYENTLATNKYFFVINLNNFAFFADKTM